MNLIDRALGSIGYIRYKNGSHFNFKRSANFLDGNKLQIATNNPVVSACISIRAQVLSQVEFYIEGANGEMEVDHDVIKLINNPTLCNQNKTFSSSLSGLKVCMAMCIKSLTEQKALLQNIYTI